MLIPRRPGRIRKSFHKAATYTLLDAAALASTAQLDLSDPATAPDFVSVSFYKIFGFPNIGALIVRKESGFTLWDRKFFGGGTVEMIISINDTWHAKKDTSLHDRLEDGTLPFHSIFCLDHAITVSFLLRVWAGIPLTSDQVHERLYGPSPMKFISHHTAQLGKQLYDGLVGLRHANGLPVCQIYKDENAVYGDPTVQGATIAFNVQDDKRKLVGFQEVEEAADDRNIYVRSGSLCNPGGVATYLQWSPAEMKAAYSAGHRCSNPIQVVLGKPTGVVRVSLGAMSTAGDVHTLLRFIDEVYAHSANQNRAGAGLRSKLGNEAPLSPPASPGPKSQFPAVSISQITAPPWQKQILGKPTQSVACGGEAENVPWDPTGIVIPTALPQVNADVIEVDKPKYPPFIPADYIKMRKPWEEEMRRQAAAMETKVREVEDASMTSRNMTPSVKARKFGRSVVNLLRTKSHFNDMRYDQPR